MSRRPFGDRVYRALLRLFPSDFRGDFGEQMTADFEDQRRDAWRARGLAGLVQVWTATLADILRRAPREQADALATDLAFAGRMMRRYLVSTAVIVTLLGVGIGANVAVFRFADPILRRSLPVPAGRELVRITLTSDESSVFSHPEFEDIRSRSRAFADVAAHQYTTVAFGRVEAARAMTGEVVSGNYFSLLRLQPAAGRLLQPSDDRRVGGHPVVVISHGTWREVFGGAPDVVGRIAHLNGHAFEIVGVAPERFTGSYTAFSSRFWAPIAMYKQVRPQNLDLNRRGWSWLSLTARLRPGQDAAAAHADLHRIAVEVQSEQPSPDGQARYGVTPALGVPEGMRQTAGWVIGFATTIAGLVLVVTCANIAGVLHSRAAARIRETSIRYALGASRSRVVRHWLTESVALGILGAGAGLVAASLFEAGLVALTRSAIAIEVSRPPLADARVLGFTFFIAIGSGLLFGVLPAWRSASRGEQALRENAATLVVRSGMRGTPALVAIQVAVCMCLIIAAGLLTRSTRNAMQFDPGFDASGLVVARLDLRRHGYDNEKARAFRDALFARLRSLPDVRWVSTAVVVPLGGDRERLGFRIPGRTTPEGKSIFVFDFNAVGEDYFQAMGIPLVSGRGFNKRQDAGGRGVVVVNETLAGRFWPNGNAVGQTISTAGADGRSLEIIGVAKDIKYYSLDEAPRPYVYSFADQSGVAPQILHVRASGPPGSLVTTLRQEVSQIDRGIVLEHAMTFDELRQLPLALPRAMMIIANVFGGVALLLAAVGIYGTMSNTVGQRAREIGVRIAFGATVGDVFRLIVRDGLTPVVCGIVMGLLAAGLVTRLIASQLFGVTPHDPMTHLVAVIVVLAAACGALSLPAHRATCVDPVTILRD